MYKKMTNTKYNVLDLFCGCGGLSKGFEMAGYNIVLGVDFNEPALKTYAYNHHGSKTLCGDLSSPDTFDKIDSLLEGKEIELRFPGGSKKQWEESGKKIIDAIPDGTKIYPGHFDGFVLNR